MKSVINFYLLCVEKVFGFFNKLKILMLILCVIYHIDSMFYTYTCTEKKILFSYLPLSGTNLNIFTKNKYFVHICISFLNLTLKYIQVSIGMSQNIKKKQLYEIYPYGIEWLFYILYIYSKFDLKCILYMYKNM